MRAIRPADGRDRPGPARRRSVRVPRRGASAAVAALLGTVLLALVGPATSSTGAPGRGREGDVPAAEAARLAREAMDDRDALAELEAVTEIDGRPVDLRSALAGVGGQERRLRLDALARQLDGAAAAPAGAGAAPAEARDRAREVLAADKFHPVRLPRPLRGPLRWIADRLEPVGRVLAPVGRGLRAIVRAVEELPGGRFILPVVGLGLLGWVTAWIVRRRTRTDVDRAGRGGSLLVDVGLDPAEVEARADAAEAAGQHAVAVRLRYEAGLVRLVRAGRLILRPDTTPASAADQVGDPALGPLTVAFEEIVYGDRPATAADSEAARHGWRQVLAARAVA